MQGAIAAAAVVIVGASAVAACSGSAPGSKPPAQTSHEPGRASVSAAALYQSPVQAALSWFYALNHKDMAAAAAHFEPSRAFMMTAGYGGVSAWPNFSALHCRQISAWGNTAVVLCTFNESGGLPGTQQDNFWTVDLDQQPDGRWLITNYGQG
jgi:hypothetical protein